MYLLENTIQEYAWGSRTFIPEMLGQPSPSPRPQAEMWMGAHPAAPSRIRIRDAAVPLDQAIRQNPVGFLGKRVAGVFGNRLPFLLKVLAASSPLSIQAHPNKRQAEAGWARENAAGLDPDSPERSYRDDNHKPEIMAPLEGLWALHGFRPVPEAAALMRMLDLPEIRPLVSLLEENGPLPLLKALFGQPKADREKLVLGVMSRAVARIGDPVGTWIVRLGAAYPGDPGVLAPLFLNLVHVEPGSAVYLGPGELHAYLQGTGVELMANSDNVLRGGLTPKHVDVEGLLAILDPAPSAREPLSPRILSNGEEVYETPAREFRLSRIRLGSSSGFRQETPHERTTPTILLVTRGNATIRASGHDDLDLMAGQSCLLTASVAQWTLHGEGTVYCARVP